MIGCAYIAPAAFTKYPESHITLADRLWIQRAPPKPPRSRTLKRKRPAATPKKRPRADESSFDEDEDEPTIRSKRSRTQPHSKATTSQSRLQPQANGRATRTSRRTERSSGLDTEVISAGKSTRAAKVQANKKLDIQAKELAEFQRQAAALARSSPRKTRAPTSPAKRSAGTRVSARLRHAGKMGDENSSDDEWQQVPDEWLQESASPPPPRRTSTRRRSGKGKTRQESEEDDDGEPQLQPDAEEEPDEEAAEDAILEEADDEGRRTEMQQDEDEGEDERGEIGDDAEQDNHLLQKAGLESGDVSDLTDLSEPEAEHQANEEEEEEEAPKARRKRGRRAAFGVRRSGRRVRKQKMANQPEQQPPVQGASKEAEPELEDEQDMRQSAPPLPPDFVEWEAVRIARKPSHTMLRTNKLHRSAFDRLLSPSLSGNTLPIHSRRLRIISRRRSTRCSLRT